MRSVLSEAAEESSDGRIVRRAAAQGWEVDLTIPVFNRDRGYLDALIP
jgi:hypothetical protein